MLFLWKVRPRYSEVLREKEFAAKGPRRAVVALRAISNKQSGIKEKQGELFRCRNTYSSTVLIVASA